VAFVNAHVINVAAADPSFARVLSGADRIYADGSGMALAAKLAGAPLVDNVNGTDLFPQLCAAAADAGVTIYLLGGKPGVVEKAAETVTAMGYGSVIAGMHHGYVKRHGAEQEEAIAAINASGASMLLVGMGVPDQEIWIARNFGRLNTPVVAGVGGLFDFFAGSVSRAPAPLRAAGLEWTWRLAQEPSRMWKRYIIGNVAFIGRAVSHAFDVRMRAVLPPRPAPHLARLRADAHRKMFAPAQDAMKRALDITAALVFGVCLTPLIALTALAIKIDSPGPVLFRQKRVGRNGIPFFMLKFRSMHINADALHAKLQGDTQNRSELRFKDKRDPRVTRVGRFIRKASIDELPQFWNVLAGEMSLVGPRPALPSEVGKYTRCDRDRLLVKPGITCTWQVAGRANIDFVGQVALDRDYVRNHSILRDIALIFRTVPAILLARGAY
jgi:exopolysaccharide biosynthesis WecB/TagA/CpsF family protein